MPMTKIDIAEVERAESVPQSFWGIGERSYQENRVWVGFESFRRFLPFLLPAWLASVPAVTNGQ